MLVFKTVQTKPGNEIFFAEKASSLKDKKLDLRDRAGAVLAIVKTKMECIHHFKIPCLTFQNTFVSNYFYLFQLQKAKNETFQTFRKNAVFYKEVVLYCADDDRLAHWVKGVALYESSKFGLIEGGRGFYIVGAFKHFLIHLAQLEKQAIEAVSCYSDKLLAKADKQIAFIQKLLRPNIPNLLYLCAVLFSKYFCLQKKKRFFDNIKRPTLKTTELLAKLSTTKPENVSLDESEQANVNWSLEETTVVSELTGCRAFLLNRLEKLLALLPQTPWFVNTRFLIQAIHCKTSSKELISDYEYLKVISVFCPN